jgi:hypothetical protein
MEEIFLRDFYFPPRRIIARSNAFSIHETLIDILRSFTGLSFLICLYKKNSFNSKMTTTYGVRNPGPGLVQTQKCGRVKPANGITTS